MPAAGFDIILASACHARHRERHVGARAGIPDTLRHSGWRNVQSFVQGDATCEAVTAAVEFGGTGHFSEALVIVRIGETDPHYAATPRIERGVGVVALLNAQLKLLTMIGQ